MAPSSKVLLILGAGKNLGQCVAKAAVAKDYKVALVSRSGDATKDDSSQVHIAADLHDSDAVVKVFSEVKSRLGVPSVVIYNAYGFARAEKENPLSVPAPELLETFKVNTISAYVAAQEAIKGFAELPKTASKTFIYTGNFLNTHPFPHLLPLGIGKTASAHLIEVAAAAYADLGYKFYYADERKEDGGAMWDGIGGPAAADYYLKLADHEKQGPWLQTFVEGGGYKDFLQKQ